MSDKQDTFYKTCRKLAGMTQEQAAPLLGVEVRRLSDYESGRANVPEDVVDRMAEAYNAPLLAMWHMKEKTPLGRKYLPDIFPTQTNNDLGFQTVLAHEDVSRAERHIVVALEDGELCADDMSDIDSYLKSSGAAVGKLMSASAYAIKVKNVIASAGGGATADNRTVSLRGTNAVNMF